MHQFLLSFGRNGHDRSHYADTIGAACRQALADLGLASGRVAFDDLRFGHLLAMDSVTITDGYDPMMYTRWVKTPAEIELLRRATRLNEQAICTTIGQLQRGMTWPEFNHAYHKTVIDLGGFVRDPGAMVWGHPCGGGCQALRRNHGRGIHCRTRGHAPGCPDQRTAAHWPVGLFKGRGA